MLQRVAPIVAALLLAAQAARAESTCPTGGDTRVVVASVSNRGEIQLADGRLTRLAGLDVPDPGRGDPANADRARSWLSLLIGRTVGLRLLAAKPDRWGRLLADMWFDGDGPSPISVSLGLLSEGLARVRPELEAHDCLRARLAAEDAARTNGLGVWTDPYYGVVAAADLDDLRGRDGQFSIVEGVVRRIGEGRTRTYLDFGRRGGFTVVLTKRQAHAFEGAGVVLSTLKGAEIRVRGAMDNRFGLRMTILGPDQIEVLSRGTGRSGIGPAK